MDIMFVLCPMGRLGQAKHLQWLVMIKIQDYILMLLKKLEGKLKLIRKITLK
jgi:hypothetical protein